MTHNYMYTDVFGWGGLKYMKMKLFVKEVVMNKAVWC